MKLPLQDRISALRPAAGFTLVEMMMVSGIFIVLVGALVAVQIFAMRIYTLGATKLTATTSARTTLNAIRDQVRGAKVVVVGTYTPGAGATFKQATNGTAQIGNALEICYTNTYATNYLIYYLDTTQPTNTLYSVSNDVLTTMAQYMTNYYCFSAEDFQGNTLSNYQNNPVIHVVMQFSQWEYPIAFVGSNAINAYDFYKIQARICRRAKQ